MISVVTPTIRPDSLLMNKKCLDRQTYKDFEWLIVSPFKIDFGTWIKEPEERKGDFYNLNKAWNGAFKQAGGELVVSIVDLMWFPPDTLEKLWLFYQENPMQCVGGIGHQYDQIVNDKPEHLVWRDPREQFHSTFNQIPPIDYELCLASLPLKGIKEVGGVDEKFDKYAALSEKEMCIRMANIGYKFFLDQTIEYRAYKHPRINEEWDKKYQEGMSYFNKCVEEIAKGTRKKLDYLNDSNIIG